MAKSLRCSGKDQYLLNVGINGYKVQVNLAKALKYNLVNCT